MITNFAFNKRKGAIALLILYLLAGLHVFIPIKTPSIQSISSQQNNKRNQTNKRSPIKNLIKFAETVNVNHTNVINLSILIPIRLRDKHLIFFTNYIRDYIQEYDKNIHLSSIIAIEQLPSDNVSFNRAALFNIGFKYLSQSSNINMSNIDYIALHDVDRIPLMPTSYYPLRPDIHFQHIIPIDKTIYASYSQYVGGVSIVSVYAFQNCLNGMSNQYFGWGAEDDDLYSRMEKGIYLPQCNLTKINFLNTSRPNLPVYADYDHLNINTSDDLPMKYHYRSVTEKTQLTKIIDYKWNHFRWKMQTCDKKGYFLRNDGLNNMFKYEIIDKQIFGKLHIIQVELIRNDSWRNAIWNKKQNRCVMRVKRHSRLKRFI